MPHLASLILVAAAQVGAPQGDVSSAGPLSVSSELGSGSEGEYVGSSMDLSVPNPWAPEARIRVDGRMDDAAWSQGALLTGFTQFDPVEGVPASQRTEVRVLMTGDAIFFGILAYDNEEGGVRATLTKRDGYGRSDDYVRILLDTFDDQRRAYVFQVNPLGVQGDGLWIEGSEGGRNPVDWNPDFLWESAGRVTENGYAAEVRIPLKSLRFPDRPVQDWGLQVIRRIQRNGYEAAWAPLSGESANRLAQSGKIRNLRGLDPGRFMEVNPVMTASRAGAWNSEVERFQRGAASGDFGMNLAYGITTNLTLDATYNPDFSQVESDAGQVTVNERFALYLPEKRPFFLEGTDVFSLPRRLVYTRSIVNPVGAAKLSGKVGSLSLAYVGARDDVSTEGPSPTVNLLRLKRDLGASGNLGLVYTDRTLGGESFNRVLGLDGHFVLGGRYSVDLLAAGSADGERGEGTEWGSLFLASFSRASRSMSLSGSFEDVGEDFRARSGFIRRIGTTRLQGRWGYTWRGGRGALVESWGPSLELQGFWNRDDFWAGRGPEESELEVDFRSSFRGNMGVSLRYSRSSFDFAQEEYQRVFLISAPPGEGAGGTPGLRPFAPDGGLFSGLDAVRLRGWVNRLERVRFSGGAGWRETPIFDGSGVPADLAYRWDGDLEVTLYPSGSMQAKVGFRHVTLFRQRDGSRYSTATIPRLQARYQFTRALFVRAIGEYSSQTRGDLQDPATGRVLAYCEEEACELREGSDRFDFSLEGLLGYEPSPGTVVFLGYSRQMRDQCAFRFRQVTTRADGLFLKVSYRFRM